MSTGKDFDGFPSRTEYTPIPNPFFSAVLPHIRDLSELKVTLYAFWALYRKKGYPKYLTYAEMRGDPGLVAGLKAGESTDDALQRGLAAAVERGTLLSLEVEREEADERLYFLNTEQDRKAIEQIRSGEIELGEIIKVEPAPTEERPNIFVLYEQHIGLLTPIIADDLKEAETQYPASWIEEAFGEAARLNKRSWRYISRILERWATEGKDDGRTRADSKEDISPKEYLRKYGHLTKG